MTKLDELVSQIQDDYKIQKQLSEPLPLTYSTTELKGEFVFAQCLISCLLHIAPDQKDTDELMDRCMDEYRDNEPQKALIEEFQTSYSSEKALWWYTRESFVYKTLNSALRKRNIHMMFLYRSLIIDLWKQLADHQLKEKLKVYRSQLMSREELEILQRNVNQLVSVNSFFSSSRNRAAALFLLGDTTSIIESERILFEIEADPCKVNSKPFSDISFLSEFSQEAEVLFMLGSIFRVNSILQPAEERVWIIRLELCSDDDHDMSDVLANMKNQNVYGETNVYTLGKMLLTMGQPELGRFYYNRFLNQLSPGDLRHREVYEDMAVVASQKRRYDESIEWRKKRMKFDEQFVSSARCTSKSKRLITRLNVFRSLLGLVQLPSPATWTTTGITIAGGRRSGVALDQLFQPEGLAVDDDGTVFIVDSNNHRIVAWEQGNRTTGRLVAGGNGKGDRMDQLDSPTDVVIDKENDSLLICDRHNRRVVQWSLQQGTVSGKTLIDNINCCGLAIDDDGNLYVTDFIEQVVKRFPRGENIGIVVAGGNRTGHDLHQLDSPNKVCVDKQGAVYVSDFDNNRVVKWERGARQGIVVAGGTEGEGLEALSYPQGIAIDADNNLYIADMGNHRVTKWASGMKKGEIIVGGKGEGQEANQFSGPMGLAFNRHGDLYVTDWENHRVQLFELIK